MPILTYFLFFQALWIDQAPYYVIYFSKVDCCLDDIVYSTISGRQLYKLLACNLLPNIKIGKGTSNASN